jgi:putative spermidine/putrescine transport system substrate-binding protein
VLTALVVVGCGSSDNSGGGDASASSDAARFPSSQFPQSTYKGLNGRVVWYDTSGGHGTDAKENTIYKNFTDLTGVRVVSDFNSDPTKFLAAMQAGQPQWNAIEFPTVGDFLNAKAKGYLQKLDPKVVPLNQLENGSYDPYGYHAERFGMVLVWNTKKWPSSGTHPTSMKDLFNTQQFPGKRCMFKYPEYGATLESALLADGVPGDQLYPLDVNRALKKLDTIKKNIVWWDSGDQAIQYLTSGECDMGIAWTGRVFNAITRDHNALDFTWQDGLYADSVYAIPKNAPDAKAAQAMLAMWIQDKQGQSEFLRTGSPYPTPIKGATYPPSLTKWLPLGDNQKVAFPEDDAWYAKNIDALSKRFTSWLGS